MFLWCTQQWDPKLHQNQGAKGRCYLHCPSARGCDISVPNALRLSLSLDLSCLGSRAVLGGVQTPVGPLGAGVSTGGWGSKPEDFKTFRENTLLKFQPCSLCRTSGVGSCSQWCRSKSRVNMGESVKVTSGWEVTSHFPSRKWQQDLATPQCFSSSPLLPPLSKCLCWIVSRFTLEIRAMCLSCRNVQCQQLGI